jgi:hypothetical protein
MKAQGGDKNLAAALISYPEYISLLSVCRQFGWTTVRGAIDMAVGEEVIREVPVLGKDEWQGEEEEDVLGMDVYMAHWAANHET